MATVALLGKGSLAIKIADYFLARPEQYTLAGVVPVFPEPAWTDSLNDWCESHGVKTYRNHNDLPHDLDLAFSCFFDKILRRAFLDRHKRTLNLHNAPLPKYRGVNPVNWALKNNEREHGVTIHEITPGIDDGPIVAQVKYSIYPEFDEVRDVYQRSLEFGWVLFQATMPLLNRIRPMPQDDAQATYYSAADRGGLGDRASWTRAESVRS